MSYRIAAIRAALAVCAVTLCAASSGLRAQQQNQEEIQRLAKQIRKKIVTLNNYSVFDSLGFTLRPEEGGYAVILKGYASRPSLKKSAERVASRMELVSSVENEIEQLPTSRLDEDLRFAVYASIYYHQTLVRYNPNRGTPVFGGAAGLQRRLNMGISNDPPQGYHPIAIIVKKGNVILEGVVDNDLDRQLAETQANTVSGVFSVTNNLQALR